MRRTHGESTPETRLYRIWEAMRQRCYTPQKEKYRDYGSRGIIVCDEWHKFEGFRDWARSHGYADDLVIDRIDNAGSYVPENCRWVDRKISSRNRTCVKLSEELANEIRELFSTGKFKKTELAHFFGVSRTTIWHVVERNQWA